MYSHCEVTPWVSPVGPPKDLNCGRHTVAASVPFIHGQSAVSLWTLIYSLNKYVLRTYNMLNVALQRGQGEHPLFTKRRHVGGCCGGRWKAIIANRSIREAG